MKHQDQRARVPSKDQAIEIWIRILDGEFQHDIAADMGLNQGRISEVKSRSRHPEAYDIAIKRVTKH